MSDPVARLEGRALVQIAGPDRRGFLQGLITAEVETLAPGELRFGALLTPQGKFLFDLFLFADEAGERLVLDVQAARRDALIQRLAMYRLRAKVEIGPEDGGVWARWSPAGGTAPAPWLADPRLPAMGARAYGAAPQPETASEDDYDAWRLGQGVPDPATDCALEGSYPIEANFDLLNGIDFKKGCFVGQETTSRMKRRGQIKSRMLPLSFDGPAPGPGAEILAGQLRAGEVLSGRDGRAMALVRLDRVAGADLTVYGRVVTVERPDWFPAD